ncbi:hypothetical protein [Streptomyces ipomoeae]|uniref:hypothetical protein n=1 Tax=Streptomyces ipomoeae TaxID=103232 RepID=UPI0011462ECC|nr:hypothetical protein [Streptomyces ipomoeae]MDX2937906.1 hypothetical protein [Streptomyces ipomoeae]TQE18287.1 hypothetical protein SipoB123_33350 [Streptomyces ipomoeae]
MSSIELPDTTQAENPAPARPKGRRLHKLAVPAVLLSLTVGGLGMSATAHAASAPSCTSVPGQVCPAPVPGVSGSAAQPQAVPRGIQAALNYWRQLHWPNFRNIAPRGSAFEVENYIDRHGNHIHGWIESGGQYNDHGNRLMDFMHRGLAGPNAQNYRGTFQEYYGSVYPDNPERSGRATGNFRIVRSLGTGDVWVSIDHYSTFRYIGRP